MKDQPSCWRCGVDILSQGPEARALCAYRLNDAQEVLQ
jgi:hypothetical protein